MQLISLKFWSFTFILVLMSCADKVQEKPSDFDTLYASYNHQKNNTMDSLSMVFAKVEEAYLKTSNPYYNYLAVVINANLLGLSGDHTAAVKSSKISVALAQDILKSDSLLCFAYNTIGNLYKNIGEYELSYAHFIKADSVSSKALLPKKFQNLTQLNKAKLFFIKNEPEKAKSILEQLKADGDTSLINPTGMHLLANYYGQSGQIEKALAVDNLYIDKLLQDGRQEMSISPFYNNKANCFVVLNKPDSAIYYIDKSIAIDTKNNDVKNIGANYLLYAEVYSQLHDTKKSNNYLLNARDIFMKFNHKKNLFDTYLLLKKNALAKNDYIQALAYTDSIAKVRTQLDGIGINTKLEALNIEYETDKKNEEIKSQKTRAYNYKIMLVLISLLFLSSIIAYRQRNLKLSNDIKLSLQEQEQKSSLAIIDAEQKLRLNIASDLHDSLGQKLTALKMYSHNDDLPNENFKKILEEVITDTRSIAHSLKPEIISLGLPAALNHIISSIPSHTINTKLLVDDKINKSKIPQDKSLTVYRCAQEAVNNALKHSKCTELTIDLTEPKPNTYLLQIVDNGVGLKPQQSHEGMGLNSIRTRMQVIQGSATITDAKPGTKVQLIFEV